MATRSVIDAFYSTAAWSPQATPQSSVLAQCWGTGGGGVTNTGAGGGGAYAEKSFTYDSGDTYTATVPVPAAAAAGGDVVLSGVTAGNVCLAKGGSDGNTGTGGQAASCVGDTTRDGGNGTTGAGGNQTGGGGAGSSSAGSGTTPGEPEGAQGTATTVREFGCGGGCKSDEQHAGGRGHLRISYDITADDDYAKPQSFDTGRSASSTSHTVTVSGVAIGERVTIAVASDGNPTVAESGGTWTKLGQDSSGTAVTMAVFHKIMTATSESVTITTSATESISWLWWADSDTDAPEGTFANGSGTNADPPTHTHSGGSAAYLTRTIAAWDGLVSLQLSAPPSGYSDWLWQPDGVLVSASIASAHKFVSAESENPGVWTHTASEEHVTVTLMYGREGAGSGGSTPRPARSRARNRVR